MRKITALAVRIFFLKLGGSGHGSVVATLRERDAQVLRSIPADAGNLLVGPHPGPIDAQLMFLIITAAYRGPAVFLMAAEPFLAGPAIRRFVLNRLGVIPVARGRRNPRAVSIMSDRIAAGWWGGIFPEGDVYFSREVMPMEYGAIRIAVEAALAGKADGRTGDARRPIFLTPFAHVYFFTNADKTVRRVEQAIGELERHPMVAIEEPKGDLPTRLLHAADRLLANKADEYQIPQDDWFDDDRFERAHRLQEAILARLEEVYLGGTQEGYARRRAMEVRMACFEKLLDQDLSGDAQARIRGDVTKTREIILMTPFTQAYREKYDDLEMWVEYLCRFRTALDMPAFNFGPQHVEFKVQPPIDVHRIADEYSAIESEADRRAYLYSQTELIRETVQAGVDEICDAHQPARIWAHS